MGHDYQFYRIMGRVTDSSARPLESVCVRLRLHGEMHETQVLDSDRTSLRGEYYFEHSLLMGSTLRIEVEDPDTERIADYKEFRLGTVEDISINFVI